MNRGIRAFGALLLVALAAGCGSQSLNSQQVRKTALAYRYTAGSVRNYNFDATVNATSGIGTMAQPVTEEMKALMAYKVLSVAPDGTATVQISMTGSQITLDGKPLKLPANTPQTFTMQISKNGSIVSGNGFSMGAGATSLPGTDQMSSLLPDHAVSPGDAWNVTVNRPVPFGSGKINLTTHNKFLRWDMVSGHQDAVIESKGTMPADFSIDMAKIAQFVNSPAAASLKGTLTYSGSMTIDTVTWLEQANGQLDKSTNHMSTNITKGFPPGFGGSPSGGSTSLQGAFTMSMTGV